MQKYLYCTIKPGKGCFMGPLKRGVSRGHNKSTLLITSKSNLSYDKISTMFERMLTGVIVSVVSPV